MAEMLKKMLVPFTVLSSLQIMKSVSRKRAVFPLYHVVSDDQPAHLKHIQHIRNIKTFEKDLETFLKYFQPVSLSDYLKGEMNSGNSYGVLTFDDGLRECYEVIAPLLKKKGVPAVFFLNNNFIDNRDLFYRYKASLLVEQYNLRGGELNGVESFQGMQKRYVRQALLRIQYHRRNVLDDIAKSVGFSFEQYLERNPVYLSGDQVQSLINDGFEIGSHSFDHPELIRLTPSSIREQVIQSMEEMNRRFGTKKRYFAFPFSSDGIPLQVIDELLSSGEADAMLGTSGLKDYPHQGFIQRIPMEKSACSAYRILKTEYLYYLLKAPFGKNRYRGG